MGNDTSFLDLGEITPCSKHAGGDAHGQQHNQLPAG
jgi:hypothetical protein